MSTWQFLSFGEHNNIIMFIIIMKLFLETRKDESPTYPSLSPTLEDLITCNSEKQNNIFGGIK